MTKTLILYTSDKGHTKKYAEYIAEQTGADIEPTDRADEINISLYENVVMASCIYAAHIKGAKDFNKIALKYPDKNFTLICVGMTNPEDKAYWDKTTDMNFNDNLKEKATFFALPGSIEMDSLGFFSKKMINMMTKGLRAKQDKDENDQYMLDCVDGKIKMDVTKADPVVEYLKKI